MDKQIINDFVDYTSTKQIARKYNLDLKYIRTLLINQLGKEKYLKIAHTIGAKTVSKKLKDPSYRKNYSEKMSNSVSKSIKQKMKNKNFKEKWLKKSNEASKKGLSKINFLLETNEEFRKNWVKNCSKGGNKTYKLKKGAFDINNLEARKEGSLRGLQNTCRNKIGPKNEKMYNHFEKSIANLILKSGYNYEYEIIFKDKNPNGFISCDFKLIGIKNEILIEVTCWDKFKEKAISLNKKFIILKKQLKNFEYIVVAPTKRFSERYSEFLNPEINCLSYYEFKNRLNMIAGVRFELTTSGL
ncbi:MAG: hypothetical protein KKH88_03800 [Nanoarchaeota archaeon]|nr:hypothetical protein [Nanoarchaeota archaeon]MBU1445518.1 hypothetical protein [Nanoarchaeota archaeon]MBU2420617.1 hypothetical protein [Nanoarchaeota archaeon]MBU2474935.1 hypothetical protein [Nanoarchaeota archaeon]MBU3941023.1 hypothetical protein [Nanoarchaeota archaeon]